MTQNNQSLINSQDTIERCPNDPQNPYVMIHKDDISLATGQHHSFDIGLAASYGIVGAILIHHFQHWIRINKRLGRNFKEGRTWTYQTRKEIQAHFPYLSFECIRYEVEKLIEKGVLISRNFNKSKIDKTLWYAFNNEKAFKVDESSNNYYERENSPSKGKIPSSKGKIPTPIPDTIPDTKTKKGIVSEPATPSGLTLFFYEKLKEINPKIRPPNMKKWEVEIERLQSVDGRTEPEVRAVVNYIVEQHKNPTREFTWSKAVASPEKLRKHFATIWLEINSPVPNKFKPQEDRANEDRILGEKIWNRCKGRTDISFSSKYLEFINGVNAPSVVLEFGSKDFRIKALEQLRKRRLDTEGL